MVRVGIWNTNWARPGTVRGRRVKAQLAGPGCDVLCVTQGYEWVLPAGGHVIDSGIVFAYPGAERRRCVLLWSLKPWVAVDTTATERLPGRGFVAGCTGTDLGPMRVVGVRIPGAYKHLRDVRTERTNAALAVPDGSSARRRFTAVFLRKAAGLRGVHGTRAAEVVPVPGRQRATGTSFLAEAWEGGRKVRGPGVALSEEEQQVQAALTDVKNKWWVAFVLGNKDVEADWDSYVAEYNERRAGKMLFDAWNNQGRRGSRPPWEQRPDSRIRNQSG